MARYRIWKHNGKIWQRTPYHITAHNAVEAKNWMLLAKALVLDKVDAFKEGTSPNRLRSV